MCKNKNIESFLKILIFKILNIVVSKNAKVVSEFIRGSDETPKSSI
jgi:hypothetical protein